MVYCPLHLSSASYRLQWPFVLNPYSQLVLTLSTADRRLQVKQQPPADRHTPLANATTSRNSHLGLMFREERHG